MTTYILEGGLGNLLFQLNFYYACREFLPVTENSHQLKLATVDGVLRDLFFSIIPVNANRDTKILHELIGILPINQLRSSTLIILGLSKIVDSPFFGYLHDKHSQLTPLSSIKHKFVFTYGHNQIPVSLDLLRDLRAALIYSERARIIRTHLSNQSFDAVLHFRAGDTQTVPSLRSDYFIETSKNYKNVLIITNDINKAKSFFNSYKYSFISSSQSLIIDLMYMVNARALICSNSTLSWWAGEISQDHQVIHYPSYSSLSNTFNPASTKSRIFYDIN